MKIYVGGVQYDTRDIEKLSLSMTRGTTKTERGGYFPMLGLI